VTDASGKTRKDASTNGHEKITMHDEGTQRQKTGSGGKYDNEIK